MWLASLQYANFKTRTCSDKGLQLKTSNTLYTKLWGKTYHTVHVHE